MDVLDMYFYIVLEGKAHFPSVWTSHIGFLWAAYFSPIDSIRFVDFHNFKLCLNVQIHPTASRMVIAESYFLFLLFNVALRDLQHKPKHIHTWAQLKKKFLPFCYAQKNSSKSQSQNHGVAQGCSVIPNRRWVWLVSNDVSHPLYPK